MTSHEVPDERAASTDTSGQHTDGAMTVSAEHVSVATEWTVSGRVRLRRRIETRTETIEVTLRREVLLVEPEDAVDTIGDGSVFSGRAGDDPAVAAPSATPEPIVLVLSEEVPQIGVRLQPYERVRVEVVRSSRDQAVTAAARREQVVLEDGTVARAE